jgi:hypothetical protein
MAYETGTVSSFDDLLTKMSTFVTANGWQEEADGDIKLFKHNRCHVRAETYGGVALTSTGAYASTRDNYSRPENVVSLLGDIITITYISRLMDNTYEGCVVSVHSELLGSLPDFTIPAVGSSPDFIAGSYSESGVSFDWYYSGNSYSGEGYGTLIGVTYEGTVHAGLGITYGTGSDGATNLTGRPTYDHAYFTANGVKSMDSRYGMNVGNPFPLTYHFHAITEPTTEFFCVLEDDSRRTETAGPLVQWMGFGEFESVAGENGFYAIACAYPTEDLLTTSSYGYHTSPQHTFYNNNGQRFPMIPFGGSEYTPHCYIYDVTIGSPWKRIGGRFGLDTSSIDLVWGVGSTQTWKGVRYGDSANSQLQAPLLYPQEFHALTTPTHAAHYADGSYPSMLLGSPNIFRQLKLTYTEHGEVVSDGAENWKCYSCYQREDRAPAYTVVSGYLFGFALRKD